MDKLGRYSLLYDFYAVLLTEKQRQIYEEVRFADLSLSEASASFGISRQGIHDTVRRVEEALDEYEEKLGLAGKFRTVKGKTAAIRQICAGIEQVCGKLDETQEIGLLAKEIDELM